MKTRALIGPLLALAAAAGLTSPRRERRPEEEDAPTAPPEPVTPVVSEYTFTQRLGDPPPRLTMREVIELERQEERKRPPAADSERVRELCVRARGAFGYGATTASCAAPPALVRAYHAGRCRLRRMSREKRKRVLRGQRIEQARIVARVERVRHVEPVLAPVEPRIFSK